MKKSFITSGPDRSLHCLVRPIFDDFCLCCIEHAVVPHLEI